jgi:hypothetical protein
MVDRDAIEPVGNSVGRQIEMAYGL